MARVNNNINSTAVIPTTSSLHRLVSCPTLPACPVPDEVLCMLHKLHSWQCSHLTSGTELEDVLTTFRYMNFCFYLQYSLKEIAFYCLCLYTIFFFSKLNWTVALVGRERVQLSVPFKRVQWHSDSYNEGMDMGRQVWRCHLL